MAENNSYPMLSARNWWNIRKKFKQTIPGTVTANYLSSVLNMQESSATNNIMPYLRQTGIIDQEGKTGERAKLWRDDLDYPQVCDAIKADLYPQELLDIPIISDEDKESIKRWFSRSTGVGQSSVNKMAAFYFLLCDKDPSNEPNSSQKGPTQNRRVKTTKPDIKSYTEAVIDSQEDLSVEDKETAENHRVTQRNKPCVPAININLQIHISSDASPEQIDKIFESMSKHIYNKKDDLNG